MIKKAKKGALLFLLLLITAAFDQGADTLIVRVHNLESRGGVLRLAVYDQEEGFLQEEAAIASKNILLATTEADPSLSVEIPDLPFGDYALAIYHDIDENGKLNTNFLGIPTEPYAFSNDPEVKWRSPRFQEARFEFRQYRQVMAVTLQRWKER